MSDINFFAETNFRNIRKKFGIKPDDRRRHVYAVGKTGMGKTAMLQNMAVQDIQQGKGVAFIDPHGEASEELLSFVPESRIKDVVYFNPSDLNFPIAFNIMEQVDQEKRHLVASGLMGVFKKIWPDVWSARMEYILNNAILALLEYPGSTLLGVNKMLSDVEYRKQVVDKITDPVIKAFWTQEFAKYTQRYETEATAAIQNKIGQFVSSPLIRNIIGQVNSTINMRDIMDNQKILILNLSKGRIGEDASNLLGALLITRIQLAAMSRVEIPEKERKDFYLFVDEFQNFATESFTNILSEARKYRLNLTLGHQYINQMEETVRDAVFGNVGTIISFRVGAEDAEFLEKEFMPEFNSFDLVNLAKYNIYLKLMIDGMAGRPFSAETLPPIEKLEKSYEQEIIKYSQEKYGNPKKIVEEKISLYINPSGLPYQQATQSAQKRQSPQRERNTRDAQNNQSAKLYDAECDRCKKKIKIPFEPRPNQQVFCKSCRMENIEDKQASDKNAKKFVSLKQAIESKVVPFFVSKNKRQVKREKKEIDTQGLDELLKETLKEKEKKESTESDIKKGVIKPGDTIKF